tara:strand:+ start:5717 stop:6451 length:735 start_codon:yes stop_codon:yes gene_type:complete
MNYNFLNNSQFVIVDYTPGSSGQLFLRLWAELDSRLDYNDEKILSKSINNNVSSTEIAYRIPVTKKIVNWFLEKTAPVTADDYLTFFEYLGNFIVAQPWSKESKIKYYENGKDIIYPSIILYAMHTKDKLIPKEVKALAPNLEILSIVPTTDRGKQYQLDRAIACYNQRKEEWPQMISQFNNKDHFETFDFCSMLVDNDTDCILKYLEEKIGQEFFLNEKLDKARLILNTYYSVVVNNLESINV